MIIIILIILLFIICYIQYRKNESFTSKIKLDDIKMDENTLIKIRQILKTVDRIFNDYDITYWAECGTLLGMIRHNNVIPWDDDGDISIFKKDEQKFLYLIPIFKEIGYGVSEWWGGYKIYLLNGQNAQETRNGITYNYKYPFVDVFISDFHDHKNTIKYTKPELKKLWPKEFHHTKDLFPLQRYKFHDFYLWGPNNCKDYLNRAYGNDWDKVGYLQYDHKNNKMLNNKKFKLKDII